MVHAAYLIPLFPLVGFGLLCMLGSRLRDPWAGWLATIAAASSFGAAGVTFAGLLGRAEGERQFIQKLFDWIAVGGLHVDVALQIDPLSMTMALFVTGVGSLIHLYAVAYMRGDPRYPIFFVYLNLFLFSMLMLVLSDSFLLMFLGWEGVGACSYFLISFWFERPAAASAGKKAFVTNRVGDFGLMLAMFLIFQHTGSLTYRSVFAAFPASGAAVTAGTATAIALLLFLGACGKSAQLPLFVWLPDAMEGPTPVSALIHAATMVTAGVYLMARCSPILHLAPNATTVIAVVGAATAFFAATIACAQNDIKRVLAYSTISQLGYMFLAIGSGAYVAALFHMITHAFFKALMFLGAGSVIHGMHEEQDMKKMGALRKWMPITSATFLVGWLAIAGIPPFSGFWSKDDILSAAYAKSPILFAVGALTAALTAYYMTRQIALVFFGKERWRSADVADARVSGPDEAHAADAHGGHDTHGGEPHESPWQMWTPLVVLAGLATVGGLVNLPFGKFDLLERWLTPVVEGFSTVGHVPTGTKVLLGSLTVLVCVLGIAFGWRTWSADADNPSLEPDVLRQGWYYDRSVAAFMDGPGRQVAEGALTLDTKVVDGAVNGVGTLVRQASGQLRKVQTGYVRNYALGLAGGTVAVLAYVLVRVGL